MRLKKEIMNKKKINGTEVTEEEFQKFQEDTTIKLILIEGTTDSYKVLTRMYG